MGSQKDMAIKSHSTSEPQTYSAQLWRPQTHGTAPHGLPPEREAMWAPQCSTVWAD